MRKQQLTQMEHAYRFLAYIVPTYIRRLADTRREGCMYLTKAHAHLCLSNTKHLVTAAPRSGRLVSVRRLDGIYLTPRDLSVGLSVSLLISV